MNPKPNTDTESTAPAPAAEAPARGRIAVAPRPADASCHVIELSAWGDPDSAAFWRGVSATLPEDARRVLASTSAAWRDSKYAARHIAGLADGMGLEGLAVVVQPGQGRNWLPIPRPIQTLFEPQALTEANESLVEIVEALSPVKQDREAAARRRSRWRRWAILYAATGFGTLNFGIQFIVQLAVSGPRLGALWLGIALFMTFVLIMVSLVSSRTSWSAFPGGVLVRQSIWKSFARRTVCYRPRDSLLIVRGPIYTNESKRYRFHGLTAELWRDDQVARRVLTPFEAVALLAAWLSPIQAPASAELGDPAASGGKPAKGRVSPGSPT